VLNQRAAVNKERSARDWELALRLEKDERQKAQIEIERQRRAQEKQIAADAKLAETLQKEEERARNELLRKVGWLDPPVLCEEVGESMLRFWVVLPHMRHADVKVTHDQNGDATLHVEAVPIDYRLIPAIFAVNLLLTSPEPITITPQDVAVRYIEESSTLEIICLNLKLLKKQTFKQKIISLFKSLNSSLNSNKEQSGTGSTKLIPPQAFPPAHSPETPEIPNATPRPKTATTSNKAAAASYPESPSVCSASTNSRPDSVDSLPTEDIKSSCGKPRVAIDFTDLLDVPERDEDAYFSKPSTSYRTSTRPSSSTSKTQEYAPEYDDFDLALDRPIGRSAVAASTLRTGFR